MTTRRRRLERFLLAGAFALALAARLLPVAAATRGTLRLLSSDCYGHLRRSLFVARHFPRVLVNDPYLNHPDGAVWIWPPAFDLVIGGSARLLFGAGASLGDVTAVAAALPPLLGALGVFPLFAFARRLFGRRRALAATFAYAAMPEAVFWSCFGHADHHVAEALALLLFLAAAARATDQGLGSPARATRSLTAGLALALALLIWQGAVFAAALGLFWALLSLGAFSALVGVAAAGVTAAAVPLYLHGEAVPFSFVNFGWFQPLLVAAGTLPLLLWSAFRARRPKARAAALALALLLAAVVVPNAGRLAGAIGRGGGYVTKQETRGGHDDFADGGYLSYPPELMNLISEAQPLLSPPRATSLWGAIRTLSPGFLLLPIALALWAWSALRDPEPRRLVRLLAVVFGAALLVMTLFQQRNVYYLAVFTSLALAEGAARLTSRRAHPALVSLGAVLLFGFADLGAVARYPATIGPDFLGMLGALRTLDPPPQSVADLPLPAPGAIAGVMAPWAAGHVVTVIVERPAAADPFQYGWRRQARLYTTPDADEAWRILREARCRYFVSASLGPFLPAYARAAGNGTVPPGSMFLPRVHLSEEVHPFPFLTRVLQSRTGSRLPDGRLLPQFRVFRVDGVADRASASPP